MFSARLINHNDTCMLNICDTELLGRTLNAEQVEKEEAKEMLKRSDNINMAGKEIISLSVDMGIGTQDGVKEIDGVPFLVVFKM